MLGMEPAIRCPRCVELEARVAEQDARIVQLEAEIVRLQRIIAELTERLNQNSSNSSKPPSAIPRGSSPLRRELLRAESGADAVRPASPRSCWGKITRASRCAIVFAATCGLAGRNVAGRTCGATFME